MSSRRKNFGIFKVTVTLLYASVQTYFPYVSYVYVHKRMHSVRRILRKIPRSSVMHKNGNKRKTGQEGTGEKTIRYFF